MAIDKDKFKIEIVPDEKDSVMSYNGVPQTNRSQMINLSVNPSLMQRDGEEPPTVRNALREDLKIPHTTKLLPFLKDPTKLSVYAQNKLNLKRYLNLGTKESKEVYMELLESGMEKELAMTILPIIFKLSSSDI